MMDGDANAVADALWGRRGKIIGFGLVTLVMLAMYALVAVAVLSLLAIYVAHLTSSKRA